MKKLVFALLLAVLLVLGILPTAALAYDSGGVTYNDHDYNAITAFLNSESATPGWTNAEKLPGCDINDPSSWGVAWITVGGEQRAERIVWNNQGIAGTLDLSNCTSLILLRVSDNMLTTLDVSGCSSLYLLECHANALTSLDVSGSPSIEEFDFSGNPFTEIKANIGGRSVTLTANGSGTVNLGGTLGTLTASAAAASPSEFVNWTEGGSEVSAVSTYAISAGDHTLAANFKSFITYNGNGADSGSVPTDATAHIPGASVTLPGNTGNLAKAGYLFSGWNTSDDYSGTHYDAGAAYTMPNGPVTLYVEWKLSYAVTFNANSATSGSVPSAAAYYEGQIATAPGNTGSLARNGYSFTGWNTLSSGLGTHYNVNQTFTMQAENITLYADWKLNFTITYYANAPTSGSPPAVATFYEGQTATISGNTGSLAKSGYVFSGWNTQASGSGTHYNVGQTFTMQALNITLYAEWNVNYNSNDKAKLQAFLAQGSNAAALGADINAPGTWTGVTWVQSGNEWYVKVIGWVKESLSGTLDLSGCSLLRSVIVWGNDLSGINVNGCTSLEDLAFYNNNVSSIDLTGLSKLTLLQCSDNKLTSLNLSGLNKLVSFGCSRNPIGSLDVSCCPALKYLSCSDCSLSSLNFNGCSQLRQLGCDYNSLTSLNVSTTLEFVDCRYNPMTQISLNITGENNSVRPISFTASGPGYVGFMYSPVWYATAKAEARPISPADFTGWTRDGLSFSGKKECDITQGGAYVASFAYNMGPLLSNVGLSAGSLSPNFSPTVCKYKVQLGENDAGVTITPEKMHYGLGMTINKQNRYCLWVPVTAGKSVTVSVVVTEGKAKRTYTFTVTRPKSSNNYLSSLSAAGTWSQPFDPNVMNYTLYLDENTKSTAIKAAAAPGSGAKVSPSSAKVTLNNGAYKDVKITVKAQSGAKRVYTIHVVRAASTNAGLKSLKAPGLTPKFNAAQTNYTVTLPANKGSISLSAKAAGYKATVSINGGKASAKLALANGETKIVRVVVASQAGNTKEYVITVTRQ